MKINTKPASIKTREGATAKQINPELQLRRSVMSCMLWEDTFYEDGQDIASRISSTIKHVEPQKVADIAVEAREKMKLRHVPLLIVREMARLKTHKHLVSSTLERVIQRADELTEFVSIYWKDKREPLSAQVKKGLAKAFCKFDEYDLAKYNSDGKVKLRDVLFLSHAKPVNGQKELWKKLIDGKLQTPDTWETQLSAGKDKKSTWERLISENKLGAMALLRNLRNMEQVGVDDSTIKRAIVGMKAERVLPFRFLTAARYAPKYEPQLEKALFRCLETRSLVEDPTIILIDVSGSMGDRISAKSELTRLDAACGIAILFREICEDVDIYTFSNLIKQVPARRGFALRDAIVDSQEHSDTDLNLALKYLINKKAHRLIVITDEQSHTHVPDPIHEKSYMVNVASYKNGIGYGKWNHIDGWSEAIIDFILQSENTESQK